MAKLTHLSGRGEARMVDVSAKAATERVAIAEGRVVMGAKTLSLDATARYANKPNFSAVARDTGFPISIAAQMIADGRVGGKGVQPRETALPAREFMEEVDRRGIRISGSGWK